MQCLYQIFSIFTSTCFSHTRAQRRAWDRASSMYSTQDVVLNFRNATTGDDHRKREEDVCFRCSQKGHWAVDCPLKKGSQPSVSGGFAVNGIDYSQLQCPCGAGPRVICMSQTQRNPGRKFYKCPMTSEERVGSSSLTSFMYSTLDFVQNFRNATIGKDHRRGEEDICFCCRKKGHWAVDCPLKKGSQPSVLGGSAVNGIDYPQLQCCCGAGPCVIWTSQTLQNPGRKYYKCLACKFFKWCDTVTGGSYQSIHLAEPSYPMCPCGAGTCTLLVCKNERDAGRKYFACPVRRGQGACNFFQWQDLPSGNGDRRNSYSVESNQESSCGSISESNRNVTDYTLEKGGVSQEEEIQLGESSDKGSTSSFTNGYQADTTVASVVNDALTTPTQILNMQADAANENGVQKCSKCGQQGHAMKDCIRKPYSGLFLREGDEKCSFLSCCEEVTVRSSQGLDDAESLEPICACGAGKCVILTRKYGTDAGRKYLACPIRQGQGACNFFKWLDIGQVSNTSISQSDECSPASSSNSTSDSDRATDMGTSCMLEGEGKLGGTQSEDSGDKVSLSSSPNECQRTRFGFEVHSYHPTLIERHGLHVDVSNSSDASLVRKINKQEGAESNKSSDKRSLSVLLCECEEETHFHSGVSDNVDVAATNYADAVFEEVTETEGFLLDESSGKESPSLSPAECQQEIHFEYWVDNDVHLDARSDADVLFKAEVSKVEGVGIQSDDSTDNSLSSYEFGQEKWCGSGVVNEHSPLIEGLTLHFHATNWRGALLEREIADLKGIQFDEGSNQRSLILSSCENLEGQETQFGSRVDDFHSPPSLHVGNMNYDDRQLREVSIPEVVPSDKTNGEGLLLLSPCECQEEELQTSSKVNGNLPPSVGRLSLHVDATGSADATFEGKDGVPKGIQSESSYDNGLPSGSAYRQERHFGSVFNDDLHVDAENDADATVEGQISELNSIQSYESSATETPSLSSYECLEVAKFGSRVNNGSSQPADAFLKEVTKVEVSQQYGSIDNRVLSLSPSDGPDEMRPVERLSLHVEGTQSGGTSDKGLRSLSPYECQKETQIGSGIRRGCSSLNERLSLHVDAANGAEAKKCTKCGGQGHMRRDCMRWRICFRCGRVGHLKKDCTT